MIERQGFTPGVNPVEGEVFVGNNISVRKRRTGCIECKCIYELYCLGYPAQFEYRTGNSSNTSRNKTCNDI